MSRFTAVLGLAAVSALALSAASAQTVTGTINLTGNVPAKCSVIPGTNTVTVGLGDLSEADGTLRPDYEATTDVAPAASLDFRVTCTGGGNTATVDADAMTNATVIPGFVNVVDITGTATFTRSDNTTIAFTNLSENAPAAAASIGGYLKNPGNNVRVTAYALRTNPATGVLVAGTYAGGKVVVTITPGA